jgi:hypothetical protein
MQKTGRGNNERYMGEAKDGIRVGKDAKDS